MESTEADGQNTLEVVGVDEVDFGMKNITKGLKAVGKKTVEIGENATDGAKRIIKSTEKRVGSKADSRYEMNPSHRGPIFIIEPLDECNEDLIQSLKALEFFNIRKMSVNNIDKDLDAGLQGCDYSSMDCVMVIATIYPEQNFRLEDLLTKFRNYEFLEGKPKIFFVQIFQTHEQTNHNSALLTMHTKDITLPDDSLLFYSRISVPALTAKKDMKQCLMTDQLSSVFKEYGTSQELLHLMLKLKRELSKSTHGPEKCFGFFSEPLTVLFTLSKKLYFFPKPL